MNQEHLHRLQREAAVLRGGCPGRRLSGEAAKGTLFKKGKPLTDVLDSRRMGWPPFWIAALLLAQFSWAGSDMSSTNYKIRRSDINSGGSNRGSSANEGDLFRPGFDSPDAHNPKGSVEPAFWGAAEEIQSPPDHHRSRHPFHVDQDNAWAMFKVKADNVAKVFIGGEQNTGRPNRMTVNDIIVGLRQANFRSPFDVHTLAPQSLHQIGMHAMICEEAHAVLLRGAGLVEDVSGRFREVCGKFQSRQNILLGNAWELLGDFVYSISSGKEIENIHDRDTGAADARFAKTDTRVNGYSIHRDVEYTIGKQKWGYHKAASGMWHIMD